MWKDKRRLQRKSCRLKQLKLNQGSSITKAFGRRRRKETTKINLTKNPNSTLKYSLKSQGEVPKYEAKTPIKKAEKIANPHNPGRTNLARPCQVAWSCHPARPGRAGSWVHDSCLACFARVLPRFPLFVLLCALLRGTCLF